MAGDWIKLQHTVFESPEVLSIADDLGLPPCHVVGCLARIWAWVDQQSETGNALSVTKVTLDRLCGVTGFADAMISAGWLDGNDRNLSLPNYDRHNGNTAKKRAMTAKRVSEHKKRKGNAEVTLGALPREEKRRVKKADHEDSAQSAAADAAKQVFDAGISLLASERGEAPARALIGRMRKFLGDQEVAALICEARSKSEPAVWLMGAANAARIARKISEGNGGERVVRLSDGRWRCNGRYYNPEGERLQSI